jgi:hypothetical protein
MNTPLYLIYWLPSTQQTLKYININTTGRTCSKLKNTPLFTLCRRVSSNGTESTEFENTVLTWIFKLKMQEVIKEQKNYINKVLHTFISTDFVKMVKLRGQICQVVHMGTLETEYRTVLWKLWRKRLPRTSWLTQGANNKTHLRI